MDASKGITNMALAHEIAVNKDFQLEKIRAEGSSVEESIRSNFFTLKGWLAYFHVTLHLLKNVPDSLDSQQFPKPNI